MYVRPHSVCNEQVKCAYPSQQFIRSTVNCLTAKASSLSLLYFSLHIRSEVFVENKERRLVVRVQAFPCPGSLQNGNVLIRFQMYA